LVSSKESDNFSISSGKVTETDSTRNIGRIDLPIELGFAIAVRETDPTPVVTRSSEVGRAELTSAMVTRSRAHGKVGDEMSSRK